MPEVTTIAVWEARIITAIASVVVAFLGGLCGRFCDPFLGADPLAFQPMRLALITFFAHALPLIDDRIVVIIRSRRQAGVSAITNRSGSVFPESGGSSEKWRTPSASIHVCTVTAPASTDTAKSTKSASCIIGKCPLRGRDFSARDWPMNPSPACHGRPGNNGLKPGPLKSVKADLSPVRRPLGRSQTSPLRALPTRIPTARAVSYRPGIGR